MTAAALAPIGTLLLVACLMAMLSRRLGLPYIVGLVIAGFLIALLPNGPDLPLSRELIFNILLPPLVFEAALQLDWRRFRDELPLTLTLAFIGVGIAATAVATGMHFIVGWSWIGAGLFGVLIAATDPVSVIAAFREMNVEKRLSIVVESESLLNDGAAAVGFAVLLAVAGAGSGGGQGTAPILIFLWATGGGVLTGVGISGIALLIAGRTEDHLIEITLTTIAAYASFLVAEHFHASGVIAALTAGLVVGNLGSMGIIADEDRPYVEVFLGICRFPRELPDLHSHWNEHSQPAAAQTRNFYGRYGDRPRIVQPTGLDLSARPALQGIPLEIADAVPTHAILGRA